MGIDQLHAEMLLHEHVFKPISGRLLTVGRQNVALTRLQQIEFLKRYGVPLLSDRFEVDTSTKHPHAVAEQITDVSFFKSFTDCSVEAIDISDYEGATIIHDITTAIPDHLRNAFDFIFDGSTLDNVFNPAQALAHLTNMLRPGGRIVLHNWCQGHPTAYTQMSPDWFMDFFAFNDFLDCKVYVIEHLPSACRVWHYDPLVCYEGQYGYQCSEFYSSAWCSLICIAEKGENSTDYTNPVQMHYRGQGTERYLKAAMRFFNSPRPRFFSRIAANFPETPSISRTGTLHLACDWGADGNTAGASQLQIESSVNAEH